MWLSVKSASKSVTHDDVIKWKHFQRYWPFVRGIRRSPVNSPHKGQWRGALMFSLIWVWINGWVNNREAGDLRRHRAHYDVIVMNMIFPLSHPAPRPACHPCYLYPQASQRVRSRKSDSAEPGSKRDTKRGSSTSGSTSGGGAEDHPRMAARRSTTSVFSVFSTAEIQELKEVSDGVLVWCHWPFLLLLQDKKKEKKSKKKEKAAEEAPAEEGGGGEKSEPKRAQRATSNVFALFNQAQIQEFKEVGAWPPSMDLAWRCRWLLPSHNRLFRWPCFSVLLANPTAFRMIALCMDLSHDDVIKTHSSSLSNLSLLYIHILFFF